MLKASIGKTVIFTSPIDSPGLTRSNTLDRATLVSVDGVTCKVTWSACLCLDWHKPHIDCRFVFTADVPIFSVQPGELAGV